MSRGSSSFPHTRNVEFNLDGFTADTLAKPSGMAAAIERTTSFAMDAGGGFYYYQNGAYHLGGYKYIEEAYSKICEHKSKMKWASKRLHEVRKYISIGQPQMWERPPIHRVSVLNGILDLGIPDPFFDPLAAGMDFSQLEVAQKEGEPYLYPHDPSYLSTVQIPVTYNPSAKCPAWERFVEQTFEPDAHELAWQIAGWLMIPYMRFHKAVFLYGSGSNGKSVFLRGLRSFLGEKNVCNVGLASLSDRFTTSRLIGKLASICGELPSSRSRIETEGFKSLTGGDAVRVEYKYGDTFDYYPFARLIFAANELPKVNDDSEGYFRRLLIIPFTKQFKQSPKMDNKLDSELTSPEELSGLLNRAVAAIPSVISDGLLNPESGKAILEEYKETGQSIEGFISSCIRYGNADIDRLTSDELYTSYQFYCKLNNKKPTDRVWLGRAMRKSFPGHDTRFKMLGGAVVRGFRGLTITPLQGISGRLN